MPSLSRIRAAVVKLSVPAIATAMSMPVLGEAVTPRLLIVATVILSEISITILGVGRRRKV
ncbi:MAG: hypothetical protein MO846_10075 [Candidatus Devosia symbiotica]|nr:hypothetical protein [Candidatus Devosia symbiotica]